jgi:hypothetical protein
MSKQKQTPIPDSVFVQPASLQDAGYKLARTGEATSTSPDMFWRSAQRFWTTCLSKSRPAYMLVFNCASMS